MQRSIAVVAAHPDDEILGCGGAIAKHVQQGDEVNVLILAEGLTSRNKTREREKHTAELSVLAETAQQANKLLGVANIELYDFPDNRMDGVDMLDIVKRIEEFFAVYKPEIVYTHYVGDVNIDHQRISQAVVTACRPQPGNIVKSLLFFEIASSTEWQAAPTTEAFRPNWFIDITQTLELKLKALNIYESEMRPWPHARSIEALEYLARWRGATVGVLAAEAFMLGRHISV